MSEYGSTFRKNDIQGSELMHLERSDIMDIGITKIGHVKRLQVRGGDGGEKCHLEMLGREIDSRKMKEK